MPGRSKILKNIGKKLIFYEPFSQHFFACENINKNGAEGASAGQYFINPTPGQEPFNERKLSLCSRRKQEQDKTSKTPWARRINNNIVVVVVVAAVVAAAAAGVVVVVVVVVVVGVNDITGYQLSK